MKNSKVKLSLASIIVAAVAQVSGNASAPLEPKAEDGMEKCYGVVKAGKNDCASKANKHGCAAQAKTDADPNEWVKMPEGLCEKLTNGSLVAEEKPDSND